MADMPESGQGAFPTIMTWLGVKRKKKKDEEESFQKPNLEENKLSKYMGSNPFGNQESEEDKKKKKKTSGY